LHIPSLFLQNTQTTIPHLFQKQKHTSSSSSLISSIDKWRVFHVTSVNHLLLWNPTVMMTTCNWISESGHYHLRLLLLFGESTFFHSFVKLFFNYGESSGGYHEDSPWPPAAASFVKLFSFLVVANVNWISKSVRLPLSQTLIFLYAAVHAPM
jgi:hypothetical protein